MRIPFPYESSDGIITVVLKGAFRKSKKSMAGARISGCPLAHIRRAFSPRTNPAQGKTDLICFQRVARFFLLFALFLLFPSKVYAVSDCGFTYSPNPMFVGNSPVTFSFNGKKVADEINNPLAPLATSGNLYWVIPQHSVKCSEPHAYEVTDSKGPELNNPSLGISIASDSWGFGVLGCKGEVESRDHGGTHDIQLHYGPNRWNKALLCQGTIEIKEPTASCTLTITKNGSGDPYTTWTIDARFPDLDKSYYMGGAIFLDGDQMDFTDVNLGSVIPQTELHLQAKIGGNSAPLAVKTYKVEALPVKTGVVAAPVCDTKFFTVLESTQAEKCASPECKDSCAGACAECCKEPTDPGPQAPDIESLCTGLSSTYQPKCLDCVRGTNGAGANPTLQKGVWTAIGCVPTDFTKIINDYIFRYGIGIAGGLAFLRFLYGCFLVMTSQGNGETLEESKAIIMSALAGLFLIIFSVFFLRTIGIDILQMDQLKEGAWKMEHATGPLCIRQKGGQCTLSDTCIAGGKNVLSYSDRFGCETVDPAHICCVP